MWSQRGAFLSQAKYSHLPPIGAPASRYINQRLSESRPAARHPRQTYPHVPAQPMAPCPSGRERHGRHRITTHPPGTLSTGSARRPGSLHPARSCCVRCHRPQQGTPCDHPPPAHCPVSDAQQREAYTRSAWGEGRHTARRALCPLRAIPRRPQHACRARALSQVPSDHALPDLWQRALVPYPRRVVA